MPEKLQMFPLIIDKWIGGTRYLTLEEKGLYLELLIYLFTEQKPIKNSAHVARICGIDPRRSARLWPKIAEKFVVNQHGSTHILVSKILNNSGGIKGLECCGVGGGVGGGVPAQEKEKEKKKGKKKAPQNSPQNNPANFELPSCVDRVAWADFIAHRKEIKKPLTELAVKKNAEVLRNLSAQDQRACVDRTISQGWTGLFKPKNGEISQPKKDYTTGI